MWIPRSVRVVKHFERAGRGPSPIGIKRQQRDKMAVRDSGKDCWLRARVVYTSRSA
jgi:hypothetical protein